MPRMSNAERRARIGVRHHLAGAARAPDVATVARDAAGVHATDAASVYLALTARSGAAVTEIDRALYDERSVVRMLGMRRTMFVVDADHVPVVQASCTNGIARTQRRILVQHIEQTGVAVDGAAWLDRVGEDAVRALAALGEATAVELSSEVPELRLQLRFPDGTAPGVSTRVLFVLAAEGRVVRGRPRGSWTSSQYRWAPVEAWLPGGVPRLEAEAASAQLVRQWLWAYGPAPAADLKWWTGWTAGQVRRALASVEPVEVELDGEPALVLADDLSPVATPEPWAALLPALDPTAMGWSDRGWFLGEHRTALFDRTGNIGPTVWWDGRVVGGWAQRKDGEVVLRLLEDVGADADAAVRAAASRLEDWLGPARVTPRFRTPLERELVA